MHLSYYVYRLNRIQYLELFQANTSSMENMNVSVNLSVTCKQIFKEPLHIAYVITFGINGNCILEELIVNASIDDIQGN